MVHCCKVAISAAFTIEWSPSCNTWWERPPLSAEMHTEGCCNMQILCEHWINLQNRSTKQYALPLATAVCMLNIVTRHTVHDLRHSRIATLLAVTIAQAQGSQKAETVNRKGREITTTGEHIPVQNHMDTIHYSAQAHLYCDKICWNILSSKKRVYTSYTTHGRCAPKPACHQIC